MSKADEMFEKLGYTILKDYKSERILHYIKSSDLSANESEHIVFYKGKTIGFYYTYCNFKKDLNMQELQAINEKVKELRLERINIMNNAEATKLYNDEIEFLDTIDILELIEDGQDLWDLMQIIEEKYSKGYYEGVIFNCISMVEFEDYLQKRYGNDIYIQEYTEYRIFNRN